MYIHEQPHWPSLHWDNERLAEPLANVRRNQGFLLGRMSTLGFEIKAEASLEILTRDVIKSSKIEGEILDRAHVRSSIAQRLGIDIGGILPADRHVEGIVDIMLDATQHYLEPLTDKRLFAWQKALFPTGNSGLHTITVGAWRTTEAGPMQVISGPMGREKVHFEAPHAERLIDEMPIFLDWFNEAKNIDPLVKAGVAHFWFVTLHPFEDGNGRIARAIADLCLARADGMPDRFYSMSSSIERERKHYYDILEKGQKGKLNITDWLLWFIECLERAIASADQLLNNVLIKAKTWEKLSPYPVNERQRKVINLLLSNFRSKLTTSKYANIAKCSQDTALRDIQALIQYGVIVKNPASGRSTSYQLVEFV